MKKPGEEALPESVACAGGLAVWLIVGSGEGVATKGCTVEAERGVVGK